MKGAALILLGVLLGSAVACSSGSGRNSAANSGTPDVGAALTARLNSLVGHLNSGDSKAILDNDVPASARRTCSDADAKTLVAAVRQQTGGHLVVSNVRNASVTGNKAAAEAVIGISGSPSPPAVTLPFVKEGGSWKFDTSLGEGCAELIPNGVG